MIVRSYEQEYQKKGIDGLLEYRFKENKGYLTLMQEQELIRHQKGHAYQTVKEIVAYVTQ